MARANVTTYDDRNDGSCNFKSVYDTIILAADG